MCVFVAPESTECKIESIISVLLLYFISILAVVSEVLLFLMEDYRKNRNEITEVLKGTMSSARTE